MIATTIPTTSIHAYTTWVRLISSAATMDFYSWTLLFVPPKIVRTDRSRLLPLRLMPTATLIRCATWRGGSTSSVAKDTVPSDGGGIGHRQEVVNCNSKDASISIIPPRMKKNTHKKKPVVKNSQPGVKKFQPGVKGITKTRKRKRCSHEGCTNQAIKGGVCVTHGAEKKRCCYEGCTNQAKKGGVCITHGATVTKKQCSFEGCNNGVYKGGVCVTHGAKRKRCSFDGCSTQSRKGRFCKTHGAEKKQCSFEGCPNQAITGGVCVTHGAKVKQCSFDGCTSNAKKGGVCYRHRSKSIITLTIPKSKERSPESIC
jgi:hypothetical protein